MTLSYHTSFSLSIQTFITDPNKKQHQAVVGIKERNKKKAWELAGEKRVSQFSIFELAQAEIDRYVSKREKMIYMYIYVYICTKLPCVCISKGFHQPQLNYVRPTQELGQDSFSTALPHSSETLTLVDQAFSTPIPPLPPLGMTQFASDENESPLRTCLHMVSTLKLTIATFCPSYKTPHAKGANTF